MGTVTYESCSPNSGYLASSTPYILDNINYIDNDTYYGTESVYMFSGLKTFRTCTYKHSNEYAGSDEIYMSSDLADKHYIDRDYRSTVSLYPFRPVINLKSDIKLSGSGTLTDPYKISN